MRKTGVAIGTAYLTIAQAFFMASGYIIHIGLGRLLGPGDYGIFAVIIFLVTCVNLILTTGIPQAVSKYVSEDEASAKSVRNTGFKLQVVLSLLVFLIYFVFAKNIAHFFHDENLTTYIRISSIIIPSRAVYSLLMGYFNGLKEYKKQSICNIFYFVTKVVLIFFFIYMWCSVKSAVLGFAISPLFALLICFYLLKNDKRNVENPFPIKRIVDFALPIIVFSVCVNLIMSLDLFSIKVLLKSNTDAGFYSAASMISRVPYSLMGALFGALFPAISSSSSKNEIEKTKQYICESTRYVLIFIIPLSLILSATATNIVTLLYSNDYSAAGSPLAILVMGIGIFAIFSLFATIISGTGKPRVSMAIAVTILAGDGILNYFFVPAYGLIGAAMATTISAITGMCIAGFYIYNKYNTLVSWKALLKIILSSLAVYLVAINVSCGGLYLLIEYMFLGAVYLLLLVLFKEITTKDLQRAKNTLKGFFEFL